MKLTKDVKFHQERKPHGYSALTSLLNYNSVDLTPEDIHSLLTPEEKKANLLTPEEIANITLRILRKQQKEMNTLLVYEPSHLLDAVVSGYAPPSNKLRKKYEDVGYNFVIEANIRAVTAFNPPAEKMGLPKHITDNEYLKISENKILETRREIKEDRRSREKIYFGEAWVEKLLTDIEEIRSLRLGRVLAFRSHNEFLDALGGVKHEVSKLKEFVENGGEWWRGTVEYEDLRDFINFDRMALTFSPPFIDIPFEAKDGIIRSYELLSRFESFERDLVPNKELTTREFSWDFYRGIGVHTLSLKDSRDKRGWVWSP
ncbi:MAG: hypothetical protein GTN36_03160 [Candidatus Aenigmarchaeota archaeon]|nr:hypothetical protein [Candidatus Aenigmarchaeota archaeon]